jgi:hypothetical protein
MSRFVLVGAQECVVGGMRRRLKAGTTVADSAANAQPGDVISAQLCANVRMVALDAAAVAAFAVVQITATIGQLLSAPPTGAGSVDA